MNDAMYENPFVQRNLNGLKAMGYNVMEPDFGYLACGEEGGKGRLPEPKDIVLEIETVLLKEAPLKGVTVLVTAGPTQEPLDPVRYITNRSSGKMGGYELAKAAKERGAKVILVTGPVALPPPVGGVEVVKVRTTMRC